ncbi:hypothetical protein DSO57_1005651 [Entomophthora muscae]|uniref:Uncharacterized protein n=1 Tax=Entomophthora muscae TaxID=34485 RepID=A0ACC2SA32_9FUNG|nr:hypothetical protein DSO57_1005651 [Entomophthora muscae]
MPNYPRPPSSTGSSFSDSLSANQQPSRSNSFNSLDNSGVQQQMPLPYSNTFHPNDSGSLKPKQEYPSSVASFSSINDPKNDVEDKLRKELTVLDNQIASKRNESSPSMKAKSELEEFCLFLEKVEKAASQYKDILETPSAEFKELEALASEINNSQDKLNSMLALKKRELEELQLSLNKKKYGL